MVTLVVLWFGKQSTVGGLTVYGYVQGDIAQRVKVCCVNVADGRELVKQKDKQPNEPLLIEIEERWLIPVLQKEAA